jgi:hypothetical protein
MTLANQAQYPQQQLFSAAALVDVIVPCDEHDDALTARVRGALNTGHERSHRRHGCRAFIVLFLFHVYAQVVYGSTEGRHVLE